MFSSCFNWEKEALNFFFSSFTFSSSNHKLEAELSSTFLHLETIRVIFIDSQEDLTMMVTGVMGKRRKRTIRRNLLL